MQYIKNIDLFFYFDFYIHSLHLYSFYLILYYATNIP